MPELPEVETVRRGLARWIVGRPIADVEVLHPRAVRTDEPLRLVGRSIIAVNRRGKYMWWVLDDHSAVIAHLGMSGQLLLQPRDFQIEEHARVLITFDDDGRQLRFVDQRTFGGLSMDELNDEQIPQSIAHIARDPFEDGYDQEAVVAKLRRSGREVKRALLDQSLISGIGNIYADESLWRAKVHPRTPCDRLTRAKAGELLDAAREVMADALAQGGTSFDSLYVNVNGESGYFDRSLAVYGRKGEPCPRCGAGIRREAFANRGSHFCPRCQRAPRVGSHKERAQRR